MRALAAVTSSSANAFIPGSALMLLRRREIGLGLLKLAVARDDRTEVGVLLGQRAIAIEVVRRVLRRQHGVELVHAVGERSSLVRSEAFIRYRGESEDRRAGAASAVRRVERTRKPGYDPSGIW